jgi:tetratricopeptide (TPR) repeat protein
MKKRFILHILIFHGIFFYAFGQNQPISKINKPESQEHIFSLVEKASQLVENYPDSSLYFSEPAYEMANEKNDQTLKYEAAKLIADACFYKNDLTKAIAHYRLAAEHAMDLFGNTSEEYASRISDIGYCFYVLQIYDLAIEHYNQSLDLFLGNKNEVEISNQYNNVGTVYFKWGKYNLATEYFSRTLQIDKRRGDSLAISSSYNNIGKVYETWGYYDIAIEHYQNALVYLGEKVNDERKALRLSNIGTSYYKKGELEKALKYLKDALNIDMALGKKIKAAVRYNEIANVLLKMGDHQKAIEYNEQALEIFRKSNRKESLAIVLKDLGAVYSALKDYKRAEAYIMESIALAREIQSLANEMAALKLMGEMYEEQGFYIESMKYHKQYDRLRDTIFNAQIHQQLANYKIKFETEKKEQENQLLRKNIIIKKRTQRAILIIGGVLFIAAVLLLLLLRLKIKTLKQARILHEQDKKLSSLEIEKKELEKQSLQDKVFAEKQLNRLQHEKYQAEIKLKNRELVHSTLQLVNKNKVLSEIKEKVNQPNSIDPDSSFEIVQLINHNTDADQNWKQFMVDFEKIHPGFVDRVRRRYPDLGEPFIRLSVLLRIELSTREIAELLNVSLAAVNKNRQRLRKKLSLPAEADLSAHMQSI